MRVYAGARPNRPPPLTYVHSCPQLPRVLHSDIGSEVFVVRFSQDGLLLAAGCNDGSVRVYNAKSGGHLYTLPAEVSASGEPMPITCLRFRPNTASSKTRNVLLSGGADGVVKHWHVTSGKVLSRVAEAGNQVFAMDMRADGAFYATAGKDKGVRVYDETTASLAATLRGGMFTDAPGHSNRVFAVKFMPGDEHTLLSGGWDNTVQLYDIR
jgi:COMPASS component SWD3